MVDTSKFGNGEKRMTGKLSGLLENPLRLLSVAKTIRVKFDNPSRSHLQLDLIYI